MLLKKYPLFSVPFAVGSQRDILDAVIDLSKSSRASSVIFANAHVVVESEDSLELKKILQKSDLVIPDGMPIKWLLQSKGEKTAERYSGPDFMVDLFNRQLGARHFFLGSTEATLNLIKKKFNSGTASYYAPPFTKSEFDETEKKKQLKLIEEFKPDFIWVGLGAPKQERHVVEMASKASSGVWLAVGAAFDFYAGAKQRAPKAVQKAGFEWAFRMMTEPKRLSKRYLSTNPRFISLALKELLG